MNASDIKAARRVLDEIEIERGYPAPGRPSTVPLTHRTFSISEKTSVRLNVISGDRRGAASHHVEKAILLYLAVLNHSSLGVDS
jgi:hypothetical protein